MKINWRTVYSHIPKSALSVLQGPILHYCPVPENRLPLLTEVYSTCRFSMAPRDCQSVTCISEMNTAVAEQPPGQGYTLQLLKPELGAQHNPFSFESAHVFCWFVVGRPPSREDWYVVLSWAKTLQTENYRMQGQCSLWTAGTRGSLSTGSINLGLLPQRIRIISLAFIGLDANYHLLLILDIKVVHRDPDACITV